MLTTVKDNVHDCMYKSQMQTRSAFPSCFSVLQGTTDDNFSPLSVIVHTFFYQLLHAGGYTCMCNLVVELYFSPNHPISNLCYFLWHVQFHGVCADTKSRDSGNADFPVVFPYSKINYAGLSVYLEQFCGPCLLNTLFQNRFFEVTIVAAGCWVLCGLCESGSGMWNSSIMARRDYWTPSK